MIHSSVLQPALVTTTSELSIVRSAIADTLVRMPLTITFTSSPCLLEIVDHTLKTSESECTSACAGNPRELCGTSESSNAIRDSETNYFQMLD